MVVVAPAECSRLNRDMTIIYETSLSNRIFALLINNGLVVNKLVQKWMNEISLSLSSETHTAKEFQFQRLSRKKKRERERERETLLERLCLRSKDETFFFFFFFFFFFVISTLCVVCKNDDKNDKDD